MLSAFCELCLAGKNSAVLLFMKSWDVENKNGTETN